MTDSLSRALAAMSDEQLGAEVRSILANVAPYMHALMARGYTVAVTVERKNPSRDKLLNVQIFKRTPL